MLCRPRPAVGQPKTSLALIALGGYGRGELNPFSDVDVMLLHGDGAGKISPYVEEMAEQILYLLWDIGFKVGHSTRSMKEALAQANRDMLTKTAMLESRFLAGDRTLAHAFRDQFRAKCVAARRDMSDANARSGARHHKLAAFICRNQISSNDAAVCAITKFALMSNFKRRRPHHDALGRRLVERIGPAPNRSGHDFLLRRAPTCIISPRAADTLHLTCRRRSPPAVSGKNGQRASEALMRDYYKHTRNIFRVTERITEQFASGYATSGTRALLLFGRCGGAPKKVGSSPFVASNFTLIDEIFKTDPLEMMQRFSWRRSTTSILAPVKDLTSRARTVTAPIATPKRARDFQRNLVQKRRRRPHARLMHRSIISAVIFRFGQLTCLVQHEFFTVTPRTSTPFLHRQARRISSNKLKLIAYRHLQSLEDLRSLPRFTLATPARAVGARPFRSERFFAKA
jgi:[protein-PII] uridylyltransferase